MYDITKMGDLSRVLLVFERLIDAGRKKDAPAIGWSVNTYIAEYVKKTVSDIEEKEHNTPDAWLKYFHVLAAPFPRVFGKYRRGWDALDIREKVTNKWQRERLGSKKNEALAVYLFAHIGGPYASISAAADIDKEILGEPFEVIFGFPVPSTNNEAIEAEKTFKERGISRRTQTGQDVASGDFPALRQSHQSNRGLFERIRWHLAYALPLVVSVSVLAYFALHDDHTASPRVTHVYDERTGEFRPYFEGPFYARASYDDLAEVYRDEISQLRQSGRFSPTELSALYVFLGQALSATDPEAALDAMNTAVEYDPSSPVARIGLGFMLMVRGAHGSALEQIGAAETLLGPDSDNAALIFVLSIKAVLVYLETRQLEEPELLLRQAISAAEQAGFREWGIGLTLQLANLFSIGGMPDRADALLAGLTESCDELEFARMIGICYEAMGGVAFAADLKPAARDYFWQALEAHEESGNQIDAIRIRNNLADAVLYRDGITAAEQWLHDNLEKARELNSLDGVAGGLFNLSNIAGFHRQNHPLALDLVEQSIEVQRLLPDRLILARWLRWAAQRAILVGDTEKARTYGEEALAIFQDLGKEIAVLDIAFSLLHWPGEVTDQVTERYVSIIEEVLDQTTEAGYPSSRLSRVAGILTQYSSPLNVEFLERALERSEEENNLEVRRDVLWSLYFLAEGEMRDHYRDRLDQITGEEDEDEESPTPDQLAFADWVAGSALLSDGQYDQAREYLESAYATQMGSHGQAEAQLLGDLLELSLATEEFEDLERYFDDSLNVAIHDVPGYVLPRFLLAVAKAAIHLRDYEMGRQYVDNLLGNLSETGQSVSPVYLCWAATVGILQDDWEFVELNIDRLREFGLQDPIFCPEFCTIFTVRGIDPPEPADEVCRLIE